MSLEATIVVNGVADPLLNSFVSEIDVEQRGDGVSSYRVLFQADIASGDFPIVNFPTLQPSLVPGIDNNLGILVRDKGILKCLINGPIEDRDVDVKTGGSGSSMVVTGRDRCSVLDRVDKQACWSGTEAFAATTILASNGFVPDVETTTVSYSPATNLLAQAESDLHFLKRMARRNGFNFWVSTQAVTPPPAVTLIDVGHFRTAPARQRPGAPPPAPLGINVFQPVIRVNSPSNTLPGFCTTATNFKVSANTEVPYAYQGFRVDPLTGQLRQVRQRRSPGNSVPFGARNVEKVLGFRLPTPTVRFSTPGGPQVARQRGEAALVESSFFVRAEASTSVHASGGVIEPNSFVKVEGVGGQDQGQYWVDTVSHSITAESHLMAMKLRRNAMGVAV